LLFGFATFLFFGYGLADANFFTCSAWLYAEEEAVWLWRHVSFVSKPTPKTKKQVSPIPKARYRQKKKPKRVK